MDTATHFVKKTPDNIFAAVVYIEELEIELGKQTQLVARLAEKLAAMNLLANNLADNLYALVDNHEAGDQPLLAAHLQRLSDNRKAMRKGVLQ
jgi:uncharacterized coiled-coil protein SlyX